MKMLRHVVDCVCTYFIYGFLALKNTVLHSFGIVSGASVNLRGADGGTALYWATDMHYLDIAQALRDAGDKLIFQALHQHIYCSDLCYWRFPLDCFNAVFAK